MLNWAEVAALVKERLAEISGEIEKLVAERAQLKEVLRAIEPLRHAAENREIEEAFDQDARGVGCQP